MDNRLSAAEQKTFNRFMRTELGNKVLSAIHETAQNYLDEAVAGYERGKDYTHDCVVSAAAVEHIYHYLKPPKEGETENESED